MKVTKKISLIALGAAALSLTAVAGPRLNDSLTELNVIATEILSPFQSEKSSASLNFLNLVTDDANVLSIKVDATYSRSGRAQTMQVNVNELSHEFNGGRPVTKLNGNAEVDLTKLFPIDQSDALVEGAEEMVKDMAKNFTKEYGDAITVDARVFDQVKNEEGHYVSFKAALSATVDLTKLPEGKKAEDMPILSGVINLEIVLNKGITLDAEVQHNPGFHGFVAGDKANLKLALEKLLTRDETVKGQIFKVLKQVDDMAANIVDASTK